MKANQSSATTYLIAESAVYLSQNKLNESTVSRKLSRCRATSRTSAPGSRFAFTFMKRNDDGRIAFDETDLIYGTVRLVERDDETRLAWARDAFACIVFNLHVEHDESRIERRKRRSCG